MTTGAAFASTGTGLGCDGFFVGGGNATGGVSTRTVGASAKTVSSSAPSSAAIRVALVSDSALFRSGLRSILGAYPAFALVGETSALPVRELLRASSPHILLVDAQIVGALTVCASLRQSGMRPWVILAGADGDDAWAVHALKSGARGILA